MKSEITDYVIYTFTFAFPIYIFKVCQDVIITEDILNIKLNIKIVNIFVTR